MRAPIAYIYSAAYHCPECAFAAFGRDEFGFVPESARDSEGNSIGALAPWQEWQQFEGHETLSCDTCGVVIDEHETEVDAAAACRTARTAYDKHASVQLSIDHETEA